MKRRGPRRVRWKFSLVAAILRHSIDRDLGMAFKRWHSCNQSEMIRQLKTRLRRTEALLERTSQSAASIANRKLLIAVPFNAWRTYIKLTGVTRRAVAVAVAEAQDDADHSTSLTLLLR